MLREFIETNQVELADRCRTKVAKRSGPDASSSDVESGVPRLMAQLIRTLRAEESAAAGSPMAKLAPEISDDAGQHGNDLFARGFTIDQVVHDYGDLCQALTELAHEMRAPITVPEFHTFNRCLDVAMADAVTSFSHRRDQRVADSSAQTMNERLGELSHEFRNHLHTAMLAFRALKTGGGAISGATGGVLERSLEHLEGLIDRSLADVRLTAGLQVHRERIDLGALLAEIESSATLEAKDRQLIFTLSADPNLVVEADRQMLIAALANLLHNAFKFTRPNGHVSLRAHAVREHIAIDVQDECGGLPPGQSEQLFRPFEQHGEDRTGVGLGLSISRRSVEANGGKLRVRDLPGKGCVFSITLPSAR